MGQKQSYGVNEESASAAVEKEGCVATSIDTTCTPSKVTKLSSKVVNTNTDAQLTSAPIHELHRTEPPDDIPVDKHPQEKQISDADE